LKRKRNFRTCSSVSFRRFLGNMETALADPNSGIKSRCVRSCCSRRNRTTQTASAAEIGSCFPRNVRPTRSEVQLLLLEGGTDSRELSIGKRAWVQASNSSSSCPRTLFPWASPRSNRSPPSPMQARQRRSALGRTLHRKSGYVRSASTGYCGRGSDCCSLSHIVPLRQSFAY
jgi:hypothetical protein